MLFSIHISHAEAFFMEIFSYQRFSIRRKDVRRFYKNSIRRFYQS